MQITIKKLAKSEIEILGVLEMTEFQKYEDKALVHISERLELPGFRKGKAPANIVREHIDEMVLLEDMAELAINDNYPKILENEKIDAIGHPKVSITKIAKGSDLEFKIITAVLPEINLPDYKILAHNIKEKNPMAEIIVDETEIDKTILELRKMRAEQTKGINHEGHESMTAEEHTKAHDIPESDYPVFDDAFAKSFGDFANANEFKEKIKANIKIEKETVEKDKLRLLIVEDLLKETTIDLPEILIESEIDKILYRLQADITNAGLNFEDYLIQIKKTEIDLRNEWREDAIKRAKLQVIIHTISEKENIKPSDEEIGTEVVKIMATYKDADPIRARAYIENMLENEKVFQFLESK